MVKHFENICDLCAKFLSQRSWSTILLLLTILSLAALNSGADIDLFHRLATGRVILDEHRFPFLDPFAFTPKLENWIDHEWLSGVVFYFTYSHSGELGLLLLRSVTFLLTALCVTRCAFLLSSPSPALYGWLLVCLQHGSFGWASVVRCQVFTYLFIAWMTLGFLTAVLRNSWGILYTTLLIFPLWCNLHGGFVLGLMLLLGFCAYQRITAGNWQKPLLVLLIAFASTAINPYGFSEYWRYLISALSMDRPTILEWLPLIRQFDQFAITVAMSAAVVTGAVLVSRTPNSILSRPTMHQLTLLIVGTLLFSGYCAFRHARFLVFYMVVMAALGGPLWLAVCERVKPQRAILFRRVWSLVLATLPCMTCLIFASHVYSGQSTKLNYAGFPVAAIKFLSDSGKSGRLLLSFNTGGYALWSLYPKYLVSMDGRYETVYLDSTLHLNDAAILPGGADAVAQINPTDILLFKDSYYRRVLEGLPPAWIVSYEDEESIILHSDTATK